MHATQFLIGQNGLDFQNDFYPDDLPTEWRFDYYTSFFQALSLPIDTLEDLPAIFADLADLADLSEQPAFSLVLSITARQLTGPQLPTLLAKLTDYQPYFTLFCSVDSAPSPAVMTLLAGYQLCFSSKQPLKLSLNHAIIDEQHLHFNHHPVLFYNQSAYKPQQTRTYLQQSAPINTTSVVILPPTSSETLHETRVIAQLLGF